MKKSIAFILAMLMLVGMLSGCQKDNQNSSENKNEPQASTNAENPNESQPTNNSEPTTPSQPQPPAAVGDILDAPEVGFDTSITDLYIYYSYPGDSVNEALSMEIAFDQVTEDSYVIYVSNGLLKLDEFVYEVTDAGIEKYYRDVFMDSFVHDTVPTYAELQAEVARFAELLSFFMITGEQWANAKFQKTDDFSFSLTGEVYTYDLIENGTVSGKISVDVETGLLVSLEDTNGAKTISVLDIKTSNLEIPEYK